MTHKQWTLVQRCDAYDKAGLGGVSVWRNVIEPVGNQEAVKIAKASGLKLPALVRDGFLVSKDASKGQAAIEDNLPCIDEAAAVGAEMVERVAGRGSRHVTRRDPRADRLWHRLDAGSCPGLRREAGDRAAAPDVRGGPLRDQPHLRGD